MFRNPSAFDFFASACGCKYSVKEIVEVLETLPGIGIFKYRCLSCEKEHLSEHILICNLEFAPQVKRILLSEKDRAERMDFLPDGIQEIVKKYSA